MKLKFKLSLCVLLLAALWWFWLIDKAPEKQKPVNVVSMQASELVSKPDDVVEKTNQPKTEELINHEPKPNESKLLIDTELSYLAIYRKYQWALICQPYLGSWQRHKAIDSSLVFDYSIEYLAQINAQKRRLGELEEVQDALLRKLDDYVVECDQVREFVEIFENTHPSKAGSLVNIDPINVLLSILLDMKAESKKEKSIKSLMVAQDSINTKQAQIIDLFQGSDTWTESEILLQEQKIQNLMQTLVTSQPTANNDNLGRRLKTLMEQLTEQKVKDKEAIKLAVSELLTLYSQAKSKLSSGDFDVFYLAKTTTEMQSDFSGLGLLWYDFFRRDYDVNYTTPGEAMLQLLEMNERHVFNQAALPAGLLYLCGLGADCGADSLLMTSYCLGFNGLKRAAEACGKDLTSFYSDGYLSLGLMQDVQLILELMETEYGS